MVHEGGDFGGGGGVGKYDAVGLGVARVVPRGRGEEIESVEKGESGEKGKETDENDLGKLVSCCCCLFGGGR